jgi:DAACS family dicarboxylate/amino acid:cation (Na+ or H+) symporter
MVLIHHLILEVDGKYATLAIEISDEIKDEITQYLLHEEASSYPESAEEIRLLQELQKSMQGLRDSVDTIIQIPERGPSAAEQLVRVEELVDKHVYDITLLLINKVIQLAPYAVAALLFNLIAVKGFAALLPLAKFVAVAVGALAVHMFVVFPLLLWFIGRMNPLEFFKKAEPVILTAFSTSSSSATLPTTLRVAEEVLGTPKRIGRFVCTLGATANMNGTALFEGVVVLFLAQFFGIELGLGQQVLVLLMCILGGIGAAGVPGGSLPVIASILVMFGIPPEGIALILGVERFIDMCRRAVNVTGDLVGTVVVSRGEPADSAEDVAAKAA